MDSFSIFPGLRDLIMTDELIKDFARNELLRQGDAAIRRPNASNPMRQNLSTVANLLCKAKAKNKNIQSMNALLVFSIYKLFSNQRKIIAKVNNQMG